MRESRKRDAAKALVTAICTFQLVRACWQHSMALVVATYVMC